MRRGEKQGKCESGKFRYTSQLAAERQMARGVVSGNPYRREVRAYLCPKCDGWHLTSRPYVRVGRS